MRIINVWQIAVEIVKVLLMNAFDIDPPLAKVGFW